MAEEHTYRPPLSLVGGTETGHSSGPSPFQYPLQHGGGGGTFPPMEAVKAQIEAAEARTDTKFSELRRDMDAFATRGTVWKGVASTIAAIVTAVGVILAVISFGGDRFDAGVSAGGALSPYAEQQRQRDAAQDKKLDEILRRLPEKK